ncbi:hypothetical protein, partial [Halobellus rarus]
MISQVTAVVGVGIPAGIPVQIPLQSLDPAAVTEAPATVRALIAFLASTFFGGFVLYRWGGRVSDAVEASASNLPLSVIYGVFAYGLLSFVVVYAYTQLARLGVGLAALTVVVGIVLGGGLLALGGLGFAVVGSYIADMAALGDPWLGLVGVGLAAAVAVLVLPLLLGVTVWFGIAAVGIGGPVRQWVHADAADRQAVR